MLRGADMPIDLQDEEQKKLFREAIQAAIETWLNSKFQLVGKWTVRGIAAMVFTAFAHWVISHGWTK